MANSLKPTKRPKKSVLITLLKLAAGISALVLLFMWVDWRAAFSVMGTANPLWLFVAACLILLVWTLDALRLHWMTPIDNLPFAVHLALAWQSGFVMQFGFGVFSGDGYRIAGYALKSGKVFKPAAHLIASRVAGFSCVGLMALIVSLWIIVRGDPAFLSTGTGIIKSVLLACLVAFGVMAMIALSLRRRQKLPQWLNEARGEVKTITLSIWALSIVMVLLRGLAFWCILIALDINSQFFVPLLASIIATLSALLPVLGGLGVREGAYTGITSIFAIDPAIGLSAAILMRLVVLLATSCGLLLSLGLNTNTVRN